jgi:hypothetical protein
VIAVLSADLMPLLEPTIERYGIETLCKRASAITGFETSADAFTRRLFESRSGRAVTMEVGRADVFLIACDDWVSLAKLPHFPLNRSEARHMVEAHLEARGEQLTPEYFDRLATSLYNFTQGVKTEAIDASETATAARDQQRAYFERRRARREAAAA